MDMDTYILKQLFNKCICAMRGHVTSPPLMEVWESKNGMQRTYFLCRRCYTVTGERPHDIRY